MELQHIGQRIKYFRERAGLTQAQLAEQIGKTTHHLTQIERDLSLPSLPMFYHIAKVLRVPTDSFFIDSDKLSAQFALLEQVRQLDQYHHEDIIRTFEVLHSIGCCYIIPTQEKQSVIAAEKRNIEE